VLGEQAGRLAKCFSRGVVKVVREGGVKKAVVANPRRDTCSREVLRHDVSGWVGTGGGASIIVCREWVFNHCANRFIQ